MDTVFIRQLEVSTYIGTHDWEQAKRQTVWLDLELPTCIDEPAASDDLADALDYEKIASEVKALLEASRFQLLESMAKAVANYLFHQWDVIDAEIRITKPKALKSVAAVGVTHTFEADLLTEMEEEVACQSTKH
jgi:dihydroneopterin aldolase